VLLETPISAGNVPTFPANTLCLTFDDGPGDCGYPATAPGSHSLQLAEYLASEQVRATFFMVGRFLELHPERAVQIAALGHQVGVHTYDHMDMAQYLTAGGDVVRQMALVNTLMPLRGDVPVYFRTPYGSWAPAVAQAMNADFLTRLACFGPIQWDVDSLDWQHWLNGDSVAVAAKAVMALITAATKGIVLMHDNTANIGTLRLNNKTLALCRVIVPQLKSLGYNMVRVDEIGGISSQTALSGIGLCCAANQMYVSVQGGGGGAVLVNAPAAGATECLTPVALGANRYAFQAPGGQYLSVQSAVGNAVTATAGGIGDWEIFEASPLKSGTVFRTFSGDFLTNDVGAGNVLAGNGGAFDPNSLFSLFVYP
jgi:peptidoglycan-N-acetylglucosamine deacetylase